MKEKMTLSKALKIKESMMRTISDDLREAQFIGFYDKDKPYIGSRTVETVEKQAKESIQSLNDKIKRWEAINNAVCEANSTVKVTVPKFIPLMEIGEYPENIIGTEEITLATAINRKFWYKNYFHNILARIRQIYNSDISERKDVENKIERLINDELVMKFPQETNKNWSADKFTEAKEALRQKHELITIDPCKLIENNAIKKLEMYYNEYLDNIDEILSVANATNTIEIEY